MASNLKYGAIALVALGVVGCDSVQPMGGSQLQQSLPAQGTVERQLRDQQLQNMQSDPSRAMQNPTVTGASPGTTGIERATTGASGGTGGGNPTAINPGTTGISRGPGVGAPDQGPVQRRQRSSSTTQQSN